MKKLFALMLVFALSFSLLAGCGSSDEETSEDTTESTETVELTIMAAASLTDALTEIEALYEEAYPNVDLTISYASSGELQTQIEQGADADVFISAAQSKMTSLEDEDLIDSDSVFTLLLNQLVVIAPEGTDVEINDLTDLLTVEGDTIAMGEPDSVPAGKYALEALEYYDMYDELCSTKTVTEASKVTEVTTYVETGAADFGFVYYSDAVSSDSVEIVYTVPEDAYSTISYPAGIVSSSENKDEAQDFLDYLQSDDAVAVFEEYGFTMSE